MAVLLLNSALFVTACGEEQGTDPTAAGLAPPPATPAAPDSPVAPDSSATPGSSATLGISTAPAASPYVEPGAGDGAPHYRENNGYRLPRAMSSASADDAEEEAARIEPVLKRLWEARTWDPKSVRTALLKLGYQEERTGPKGERLGGTLGVRPMEARFETDHYVTPEGTRIGLRVHDDACVTAFVQTTNYQVSTNGLFPETGCFEPRSGH